MTFTTNIFLIGLLPWFLCLLKWAGNKKFTLKIILLFFANSLFYVWGGVGAFIFICGYSILVWMFSFIIKNTRNKYILAVIIIFTITPLLFVKYTNFVISNLNSILGTVISNKTIVVPIGISFYTFQAVSLIADVHKGKVSNTPGLMKVYLYLTFFPTVSSGPIIRYNEFESGLVYGANSTDYVVSIERIIIGLAKKILIADKIAILSDYYFDGVAAGNIYSCAGLWIGSIACALQIYFDFSGYSDMAIGIGQLLGFDIKENFNKPYLARSISDFWKRWHISLTQWFKDYVYIPLGGNRCAMKRHILNMLIVWLITGIWHGADWSFIIWGLGYFLLLTAEKYIPFMKNIGKTVFGHIYALFFINLLWVPFRADNSMTAADYILGMFGGGTGPLESKAVAFLPFLIIAVLLCLPWNTWFEKEKQSRFFNVIRGLFILAIFVLSLCASVNSSYAPFIYGNF